MRNRKIIFTSLALSFVLGLSLVTAGLASLPPAYQQNKTVMLNPNIEDISKELILQQPLDNETIVAAPPPAPKPVNNKHAHVIKSGETLAGILQNYGRRQR